MIGPDEIEVLRAVHAQGILKPDFTVIDLDRQDLAPDAGSLLQSVFGWDDAPAFRHAGEVYARLGSPRYESVSLDGGLNAHAFDIEQDLQATYGFDTRFDLVVNFGASARRLDQKTVFSNIHALTVEGGVMIHMVPSGPSPNVLFCYSAALFWALAKANGYHVQAIHFVREGRLRPGDYDTTQDLLCVMMIKTTDRPFVMPGLTETATPAPAGPPIVQGLPEPADATSDPVRSLLLVSVPKSGTVYLNRLFTAGVCLADSVVCLRSFPADQLSLDAMSTFVEGGGYASVHIDPSRENLQILDAMVPKWILHLRDPRSVTLSWVHHVARLHGEGRGFELFRVCPMPPAELHDWPFEARVDWHLEHFLPAVVSWMTRWLDAAESRQDRVLVTEFQALKDDEPGLARTILAFLGIDPRRYSHRPPEKTLASHFRVGATDEWRASFTARQIEQASAALPVSLLDRFGWPRG